MVAIALYDWPPSPFCMKVRAVLAHKELSYRRIPALANTREIYRRGGVGKVPALDIDGTFIVDSTSIAHELERRFPAVPILPTDARERAQCDLLEDWADESLYFYGLYCHWHEPDGRKQVAAYFARTLLGRIMFRPYLLRIERQLRGHGISRKSKASVREDLDRLLDAIEATLAGRDFLLGNAPYLCDFALAGQLAYLLVAPATRAALAARPNTGAFLQRMAQHGLAEEVARATSSRRG
jgi:glutathione S-transferase